MGKYFFKPDEIDHQQKKVSFTGQAAHYFINVLRMRVGQQVTLCDGMCTDYVAIAEHVSAAKPHSVTFTLLSSSAAQEPPICITLYQGLPKGDKMDWIIEKCIEVGVTRIIPVCTTRSVAKIKDAGKKAERFARIAESAASQSMRGIIPQVSAPVNFEEALQKLDGLQLVAYENERNHTIKSVLSSRPVQPLSIWIGPEGGFDESEIQALTNKSALCVSLGSQVLRTETAGLVALAQILCIWDDR